MNCGKYIRTIRLKKHITNSEVCSQVGISPSTLSRLELGHIDRLSAKTLGKIAKAIGVNPDELYKRARVIPPDIEKIALNHSYWHFMREIAGRGIKVEFVSEDC